MRLQLQTDDGHQIQLWPIGIRWARKGCGAWLSHHLWQTGFRDTTGLGCVPGKCRTYGATLHLGRLKLCFGPLREKRGRR